MLGKSVLLMTLEALALSWHKVLMTGDRSRLEKILCEVTQVERRLKHHL